MEFVGYPDEFRQRFQVVRLVGEGGMGQVYLARDLTLDRPVAIKLLHPRAVTQDGHLRMVREARAMAALAHPGLVRILSAELSGARPVIVMEWLEGQSLAQRLVTSRLSAEAVSRILRQLLESLSYMHARDILHRDLKPSNILLKTELDPVLIDFGLAMTTGETRLTAPGLQIGTVRYFAPEIFRGANASVATELFALAMVGLEMLDPVDVHDLTEDMPADRVTRLGSSLLSGAYFAIASTTLARFGALGEVLCRALEPNAGDRFESADQMRDALAGRGERSQRGVQKARQVRATVRRSGRRKLRGVAAAIFGGLASVGVLAALFRHPSVTPGQSINRGVVAVESIRFGTYGSAEISLTGDPPAGTEVRFLGEKGVLAARPDGGGLCYRFRNLPAGTRGSVEIQGKTAGGFFETPIAVRSNDFKAVGMNRSILVDFQLEPPVGANVELYRRGRRVDVAALAGGADLFRHVFRGLEPEADYSVRVVPQSGWGGVTNFIVRTLSEAQGNKLQRCLKALPTADLAQLPDILVTLRQFPDLDAVDPLVRWYRSKEASAYTLAEELPRIAEALRSRELAGTMLAVTLQSKDVRLHKSVLAAAGAARVPEVVGAAREALGSNYRGLRAAAVHVLGTPRAAEHFDALAALVGTKDIPSAAVRTSLIHMDRARARALFHEWSAAPHQRGDRRTWCGMAGLAELGEAVDRARLLHHLRDHSDRENRSLAALALARLDGVEIQAALFVALSKDPENAGFIVACSIAHTADAIPVLLRTLHNSDDHRMLSQAIIALATLGETGMAGRCCWMLSGIHDDVRMAAAWALGRLRAPEAFEPLASLVKGGWDSGGVGSWALSQLGGSRSYEILSERVNHSLEKVDEKSTRELSYLALAVGNAGDPRGVALLDRILQSRRTDPYCRECTATAKTRLMTPDGDRFSLIIPAPTILLTGAQVRIGDAIRVRRFGFWLPGGPAAGAQAHVGIAPALLLQGQEWAVPQDDQTLVATCAGELRLLPYRDYETGLVDDAVPDPAEGLTWLRVELQGTPVRW